MPDKKSISKEEIEAAITNAARIFDKIKLPFLIITPSADDEESIVLSSSTMEKDALRGILEVALIHVLNYERDLKEHKDINVTDH